MGIGLEHLGIIHADRIMRGIVPVVMAGILGIYGLIVAVIINNNIKTENNAYASFAGYMHFGAGLAAGLSSLAAGLAIGIVGDTSVRAYFLLTVPRAVKCFLSMDVDVVGL